ncbi:FAD-dependent oxidoreductase [Maribacter sp. 1_MG-2023]|uniref:FAD-dependent oxidoreductase n=1 Tax=Maribacter sp. 1_MG-2023 TaxID=3062677 RepID=UPI0026E34AA4|nr:FAD-dependent oxidoreductase [Maribacter sp. 1_MG-2023]MDO6473348.1 FAD-dependent oxidoreductase [Maribacter sp. 1_MG-2023]
MERRKFFKRGTQGAIAASMMPIVGSAATTADSIKINLPENGIQKGSGDSEQWHQMGNGKRPHPDRNKTLDYEVVVIGGGAAGICAAVAAARNGAKTVLVQDRPVLGGNASSEIRVHLNGVNHLQDGLPERETGIIEEFLLLNRFQNPQESFTVWDHVLYDFVTREPNLDLLLNTSAMRANTKNGKILSAYCYQLTTELEFTINGKQFIDCSGDGLLAATAGALYRTGREAAAEFNERYAPKEADGWQMGGTVLLSSKDMGRPMPFEPPSFVRKYETEKSHKGRKLTPFVEGFWWVELGSDDDIIADYEENRHKLMGYAYGVWDYVKNSGKFPESENYALDWVCSLPGKRESRRFIGDFILSEGDLLENRNFEDAVAFGGWSLDEHNPGGIENLSEPPSYFHARFAEVYQIPFRSLYSKNVSNLLFAGRNISQTHMALSSSRIMATCALEGQAVGTAAALCLKHEVMPKGISEKYVNELQEQLMRDDAFIPKRPANDPKDLAKKASLIFASSTTSGDAKLLTDGMSRDIDGEFHHWQSDGLPATVQMEWENPISLSTIELKCDTNVKRNIMMRKDSSNEGIYRNNIPEELMKSLVLEARVNGEWMNIGAVDKNKTRLVKFKFNEVKTTAIRIQLNETYGHKNGKLFELRAYEA